MEDKKGSKEKNKKDNNLIAFTIKMLILILIVEILSYTLPKFLTYSILYGKYGSNFIVEVFLALLILLVIAISKNFYIFSEKREKFLKTLVLGLPMLIFAIPNLFVGLSSIADFSNSTIYNIVSLALYCITIGIYEEFLCRGWIQNDFIERFGKNRKGVIICIILSAFIFGFMHIINIFAGQGIYETIMQIIQATACGIFLGSIYYRSKNIWALAFLHGFYDFSLLLSDANLIKDCTSNPITNKIALYYIVSTIIISIFYILASLILLRKSKINPLIKNEKKVDEKTLKNDSDKKVFLILAMVFIFFVPVPGADSITNEEIEVCYEFNEKKMSSEYEKHYPNYNSYDISHIRVLEAANPVDATLGSITKTEKFLFNVYITDNKVYLKNAYTSQVIDLGYENVENIVVVENGNVYGILIYTEDDESTIYYSNFMTKENLINDENYLTQVKDSFKEHPVPYLAGIGYLTSREQDYIYPFALSSNGKEFIIDAKNDLYIIEQ